MLRPRIIPCLLVKDKGLVKTRRFKEPKYVGDPINAVKIFNEKGADELVVLDIDASSEHREPDYRMIEHIAAECRMPLCYGGGIKTVEQAQRISNLGVEKVAVGSLAVENPGVIARMAESLGSQSVVVVLDVKKRMLGGRYDVHVHNGKKNTRLDPAEFSAEMERLGAGEIMVNSIDHDGGMMGYDFPVIDLVRKAVNVPLTALGGAGKLEDIGALIRRYGIIGASAGSFFVFKGVYRAVLISYPDPKEKDALLRQCLPSA